jgi:hypothetical protein
MGERRSGAGCGQPGVSYFDPEEPEGGRGNFGGLSVWRGEGFWARGGDWLACSLTFPPLRGGSLPLPEGEELK